MKATAIENSIVILRSEFCEAWRTVDGFEVPAAFFLETPCRDYSELLSLPNAVTFEGRLYGKSGWNSDTYKAYYNTNIKTARKV